MSTLVLIVFLQILPFFQVFHTVSPALAFQYVSLQPPDLEGRVPAYTDNLNSWLGQILQVGTEYKILQVGTLYQILQVCTLYIVQNPPGVYVVQANNGTDLKLDTFCKKPMKCIFTKRTLVR